MAYEVLARKWRPQVFEDVVGQVHVTKTLQNAIISKRIAHAYLFCGPRGVGKTSVARILAKTVNCDHGESGIPCNQCRSCLEITEGSSVDVQEIDGASNRGIEEIRELRDGIKYMPSSSRYRIYIIDEIHMLTLHAFNALLKTLEEPPEHVKFIFATTESHKVPATIHSRCQKFDFRRLASTEIVTHLKSITKAESIEISETSLASLAKEAEGSMRDAESLLDQVVSFAGKKVHGEDLKDILGIMDRSLLFEISRAIIQGDAVSCLRTIQRIYEMGYDIKEFYSSLMDQFRNLLVCLIAPGEPLSDMTEDEKQEALLQAEKAGEERLQIILNFLISKEGYLRTATQPRLIFETTVIKLCGLGEYLSYGELFERLEALEKRLGRVTGSRNSPDVDRLSEPRAPYTNNDKRPSPPDTRSYGKDDEDWDAFLAFVFSKNQSMFKVLKECRLLELDEHTLKMAKGHGAFTSKYFDNPQSFSTLSDLCREFFDRSLKILIVENNVEQSAAEPPRAQGASKPETRGEDELSLPVKKILDRFQGNIRMDHKKKQTEKKTGKSSEHKEDK